MEKSSNILTGRLSRSPYGERGLKSLMRSCPCPSWPSLSLRRAWIEIVNGACPRDNSKPSLSLRRAWIEIQTGQKCANVYLSLSLRRAWIEIVRKCAWRPKECRSLSLRRAWIEIEPWWSGSCRRRRVALLTESVD